MSVLISTIPEPKLNVYISINHCRHIYTEYILPSPYVYTVSIYPSLLYPIIYRSMFALFHHININVLYKLLFPYCLFCHIHWDPACAHTWWIKPSHFFFNFTHLFILIYTCANTSESKFVPKSRRKNQKESLIWVGPANECAHVCVWRLHYLC